jgi:hypothetical protein
MDEMPPLIPRPPFMGMPLQGTHHQITHTTRPGGGYSISGTFVTTNTHTHGGLAPNPPRDMQDVTTNFMQMLASLVPPPNTNPGRYQYTPGATLPPRDPNNGLPNRQVDGFPQ